MQATPEVAHTEAQHTAVIPLKVSLETMQQVFGPTVGELLGRVLDQGGQPSGPIFAHHFHIELDAEGRPAFFDFEIGIPVAAPIQAVGRMLPGEWPAQRVVRTVHQGPYEGLPDAWGRLMAWVQANGHAPAKDLYERYLTNPDEHPDPATWQTELVRPLKG